MRALSLQIAIAQGLQKLQCWKWPLSALITFALSIAGQHVQAQDKLLIKGRVLDDIKGEGIPFAHIVMEGEQTVGAVSGIEGYYRFKISENMLSDNPMVVVSCLGYESRSMPISDFAKLNELRLNRKITQIEEVSIRAGRDPAYDIMRRAIERRAANDPENLESFSCTSYNKASIDVERSPLIQAELDSTGFAEARFFMLESTTELSYRKPRWTEEIIGTRISGVKRPEFAIISNSFQPFSTYRDHLNLLETDYLNPLSPGSERVYRFVLMDSVEVQGEKVYLISFRPRKGERGHLLEGLLSIADSSLAIVNLRASNSSSLAKMQFEIRQKYEKISKRWFPKESRAFYRIDPDTRGRDSASVATMIYSTTYLSDIVLEGGEHQRLRGPASVRMRANAGEKSEEEWAQMRPFALESTEENTYLVYDTLSEGIINLLNWSMNQSSSLANGRLKLGKIDLMMNHLLRINRFEGLRLGLGLSSNRDLIKWMSMEGYFAYGFRDMRSKYGGALVFHLSEAYSTNLRLAYRNDVVEPGRSQLGRDLAFTQTAFSIRNLFTEVMDRNEVYEAVLSSRPGRSLRTDLGFRYEQRQLFPHFFADELLLPPDMVTASVLRAQIDWVPGQSLMQVGRSFVPMQLSYPRLRLSVESAVPEILETNQSFTRLEWDISHQVNIRRLGVLSLFGGAGRVWGSDVALPFLHFGRGIDGFDGLGLEAPGYFQTMPLYDFLMDEFAYAGLRHDFGTIFGIENQWSKPRLKVSYTAGIGNLSGSHQVADFVGFRQMNKAYLESGLIIDDILRYTTRTSVTYSGFGAGVYWLHGHYSRPSTIDNFSFVISFTNSF